MRLVNIDAFLSDLYHEGCDVIRPPYDGELYGEYGYSYDLIEKIVERQSMIVTEEDD